MVTFTPVGAHTLTISSIDTITMHESFATYSELNLAEGDYTLKEAYAACQKIAKAHYENFPVASFLLPAKIRKHVAAIYAFARHADDLSDEYQDKEKLLEWRSQLHRCLHEKSRHPVFMALSHTIKTFDLPISLPDDLLLAFLTDLEKNRYNDFEDLFSYCRYSANPIGRILLYLHGYRNENLFTFSDNICTALQLTNFWQDVRRDLQINRIYIPSEYLLKFGYTEEELEAGKYNDNFKNLMKALLERTSALYDKGFPLIGNLKGRLRWELKFTVAGGMEILRKIEKANYDVLHTRPQISGWSWVNITTKLLTGRRIE